MRSPGLIVEVEEGPAAPQVGVANGNVQMSVEIDGPPNGGFDVGPAGDVSSDGGHGPRRSSLLRIDPPNCGFVVKGEDAGAFIGERRNNGPTHWAACPGHKGGSAGERPPSAPFAGRVPLRAASNNLPQAGTT